MQSYIVRIYRRERNNPGRLVGVVEEVGVGEENAFHTRAQLWQLLTDPKARARRTPSPKGGNRNE